MDDEVRIAVSVPVDSDGFLRRECPTCEREFKWLPSDDEDSSEQPDPGGYFCPYCGVQAPTGDWLTQAQAEYLRAIAIRRVVDPKLDELERSGLKMKRSRSEEPAELTEDDDMRRIDFACHPGEPLKVLEEWEQPVLCLICGTPAGG